MFWTLVILIAIVFVLTYDPKSRGLDKLMPLDKSPAATAKGNYKQCEATHFQSVQFAQPEACPLNDGRNSMGAIIHQ